MFCDIIDLLQGERKFEVDGEIYNMGYVFKNGEFVKIYQHNIHIYRQGNENKPKIVFMSGSGTVAPVYDFKILYEKLLDDFRIIVIENKIHYCSESGV